MNFALLGTSPLIRQFELQLADSKAHQTVFSLPDVNQIDLVALEQSGAQVIVLDGIGDETVLLRGIEVLKAFDGLVLLAQFCTRTVLTAYEVERLAGDAVGLFAPILPLLQHPAMEIFRETQTDSTTNPLTAIGQIERVEMERVMQTEHVESVLDACAQDLTVLVALAGPIKEVVAMRVGSEPVPLNVQGTSQSGPLVRWSAVRPCPDVESARILIEGTQGRVVIRLRETGHWDIEADAKVFSFPPLDFVTHCGEMSQDAAVRWTPVTHSLEVREAVAKSLQRGRLIRLNLDGHGERTAFKGTMASLGCALLLGGLVLLIISAAILSLAPENGFGQFVIWIEKIPWVLAGLMVLFLLIQLFVFVIPRRSEE